MKLRSSKRGDLVEIMIMPMIAIALAIGVLSIMLMWAGNIGESKSFEKKFLSRDFALMIDAMYAVPGQAVIQYSQDTFGLKIEVEDNKVIAYGEGADSYKEEFYFNEDKRIPVTKGLITTGSTPIIFKKSTSLDITRGYYTPESITETIACPEVNTAIEKGKEAKVLVYVKDEKYSGTRDLLIKVYSVIGNVVFENDGLEIGDNAVLGIGPDEEEGIRVYYTAGSDRKAEKLACMISNNVANEVGINVPLAPIDGIEDSEFKEAVKESSIAIYIEAEKSMLDEDDAGNKISKMGSAINNAIKEYYHEE